MVMLCHLHVIFLHCKIHNCITTFNHIIQTMFKINDPNCGILLLSNNMSLMSDVILLAILLNFFCVLVPKMFHSAGKSFRSKYLSQFLHGIIDPMAGCMFKQSPSQKSPELSVSFFTAIVNLLFISLP